MDIFPFAVGNMAMVIGGRHAGRIGRIATITPIPGATPNTVALEDANDGIAVRDDRRLLLHGRARDACRLRMGD